MGRQGAEAFSRPIESEGIPESGLVLIHASGRRRGWRAWPDPYPLTFAGVSLARLRADRRVERRRSGLASARRARSDGGLRNGARAKLELSAFGFTRILRSWVCGAFGGRVLGEGFYRLASEIAS